MDEVLEINIEALDKQIHEYWLENIYMSYALDCVDSGIIESMDALVKRPVSNAKLLTNRYRRYRESFAFNNLEEKEDLKFFEEAIRRLKEMWEQIKSVSKLEGRDDGEERLKHNANGVWLAVID